MFSFEPSDYPRAPGCYILRDATGAVIYVGKAKDIRARLRSHFRGEWWKSQAFRDAVAEIELMLVTNEHEALLLESNLIKAHQPQFNGPLKDEDQGYFFIVFTDEPLPRLVPYRRERINKGLKDAGVRTRFGPYVSRRYRDTLITLTANRFQLRTCSPLPATVCLRFHLGICGGICEGHVDHAAYALAVRKATAFLRKPPANMAKVLRAEMEAAASRLEYEWAAAVKQQIRAVEVAALPQAVELRHGRDATYAVISGDRALVATVAKGTLRGFAMTAADAVPAGAITAGRTAQERALLDLCRMNLEFRIS